MGFSFSQRRKSAPLARASVKTFPIHWIIMGCDEGTAAQPIMMKQPHRSFDITYQMNKVGFDKSFLQPLRFGEIDRSCTALG
jgi:hypothetical protein